MPYKAQGRKAAWNKAQRDARRTAGLCTRCGKHPAARGYSYCAPCVIRIAGNVGPATCGDNTGWERSFGMPTRNIQTTCPYCGRYGWHARTIKHEGAAAMFKCSACKKDHRKD